MIIIGIALSFVGLGFVCWLLFTLAIYALPFFAGLTAGLGACHSGAGPIGAVLLGLIAADATLAGGQVAFAITRPALVRAAIAILFTAPAVVAGYHLTLGLAHIAISSELWAQFFAVIGGLTVGATAWARLALLDPWRTGQAL